MMTTPQTAASGRLLNTDLVREIASRGASSVGPKLGNSTILRCSDDDAGTIVKWWDRSSLSNAAASRLLVELTRRRSIESPGVPKVFEIDATSQGICATIEYVPGATLASILDSGRLPVRESLEIAVAIFSTLATLHRSGVLHRDIKARNVIIRGDDLAAPPVLVDVGASRAFCFGTDTSVLESTAALYLSPEQAGSIDYDVGEPADLYSAGILLFHCLTGHVPFQGSCISKTLLQHLTAPVPELRGLGVDAPDCLEELVQRLLKKDPRDRYQCADAVHEDLTQILAAMKGSEAARDITIGRSDRRQTLVDPPIVGRRAELAALDTLLRGTAAGAGKLACIEAEAGGGKSRLLGELVQRAHADRIQVLLGHGTTDIAQRPLTLFSGVADAFMRIGEAQPEWLGRVQERMGHHWETLLSLLPQLAQRFRMQSTSAPAAVPDDFAEARSIDALVAWFDSMGEPEFPVIIAVDDCQWADGISIRSIQQWHENAAARDQRFVSIVFAFRGEEVPENHRLRSPRGHIHLRLGAFSRDDIYTLVESMAGVVPAPAVEIVADLADGSPFMATALLRGLVERGALVAGENGWHLDSEALAEIQSSRQAACVISKRIESLSPDVQEMLSVAAVIGKEFDVEVVASLARLPLADALHSVDDARQRKLLWSRPDGTHFVFIHDIIRRAFCERLDVARWRTLNRRAAVYFERHKPEQISDIAFFYDAAGEADRARPFAIRAAEYAKSHFSLEPAEAQYRIALKGLESSSPRTRIDVLEGYSDVLIMRGRYDDAEKMLADALDAASDGYCRSKMLRRLADVSFKRGNMDAATRGFEEALRALGGAVPGRSVSGLAFCCWQIVVQILHTLLPRLFLHRVKSLPDPVEILKIQLYSNLAHGGWYCRSKLYCLGSHLRGMNMAERYQPSSILAAAYAEHAPIISLLSLYRRGFRYANKSLAIRQTMNDKWGQGQALHYHGIVLYAAGEYRECIHKCESAISLLLETGDYWQVHIARYQIAAAHYHLGHRSAAVAESKKNYASGRRVGDNLASSIIMDVWVRASRGGIEEAILNEAFSNQPADVQGVAQVQIAKGIHALYHGDFDGAIEHLTHAVRLAERAGLKNVYTLPAFSWLSTAYRKKLEAQSVYHSAERTKLLSRALKVARAAVSANRLCQVELPRSLKEYALLVAMRGNYAKSRRLLDRALKLALRTEAGLAVAEIVEALDRIGERPGRPLPPIDRSIPGLAAVLAERDDAHDSGTDAREGTLSLVDRFDTLLDVGRRIALAITSDRVFEELQSGSARLLRGERCELFHFDAPIETEEQLLSTLNGRAAFEISLAFRSVRLGRSVSMLPEDLPNESRSLMCSPVSVRGTIVALLCTSHDHVSGLFGPHEQRLADFIATIAGAALENAEGFLGLRQLNDTLEQRIAERTEAAESRSRELADSNSELRRIAIELRETEDQLRHAIRDAEAANHAKSEFLATLGHEIRTPMNGILGMTELALASSRDEQQRKYLAVVRQSGDSLLSLLNDVLDLSKVEAGRMELESIPINLQELVGGIVELMAVPAANKGVELLYGDSGDLPQRVLGDPTRLRQVILNLIGNAVKFTEQGYVSVHLTCQRNDADAVEIEFAIADTGIGIVEEKRQTIFQSFCQSDSSTSRRFGGTGLGLTICARLVELMGSDIGVESTVGEGSCFRFSIRFDRVDHRPAVANPATTLTRMNGLIVGPTPRLTASVSDALRAAGATVESIYWDGRSEEPQLRQPTGPASPDFLIIDTGPDPKESERVLRRVLAQHVVSDCRVLALVPLGDTGIESSELRPRVQVIHKPLIQGKILNALVQEGIAPPDDDGPAVMSIRSTQCWKILVADDSEINRDVAVGLLEMLGHECFTACSGIEAVEMAGQLNFDAVLMDLEMPNVDGIEATRRIRMNETDRRTPIIAVTAHALSCYEQKCFESGMDGYLSKPFVASDVVETLERIISANAECVPM